MPFWRTRQALAKEQPACLGKATWMACTAKEGVKRLEREALASAASQHNEALQRVFSFLQQLDPVEVASGKKEGAARRLGHFLSSVTKATFRQLNLSSMFREKTKDAASDQVRPPTLCGAPAPRVPPLSFPHPDQSRLALASSRKQNWWSFGPKGWMSAPS